MPNHPFYQIADIAPVMLWMTDPQGVCTYLSRSWYDFTGQTPLTGLRLGWLDSVHPDDRALSEKQFLQANQQQESFQHQYRLRDAQGQYHWMLDAGQPRFGEVGEFLGYVGSVIDITESKLTAEALRERENRYQQLFSAIDEGFVICEMIFDENRKPIDYRFLEANRSFGINTGLPMPYALGRTARELIPTLEEFWFETYGNVVLTGESTRFEQFAQPMHRWFDAYAFSIGGDLFAILFTDITERRKAQMRAHLLQTLAAALAAAQTLDEVIKTIMTEGVRPLRTPKGVLGLLTPDGQEIEIKRMLGYSKADEERWRSVPIGHTTVPFALAVREGTPLWLGSHEQQLAKLPSTPDQAAETHQAWAVLPLKVGNTLLGVLALGFEESTTFEEAEQTFLLTLADYSAQAIERARLGEQANIVAADAERQRLARDLHDAVSQLLFASTSITEGLSRTWERDPDKGRARTEQVLTLNRAAMAEMRKLLLELRPEAILRTPFYELLEQLVRALRGLKEIDVELTFHAPTDLIFPHDVHVALYRVVQEALNNVGKHSYATQVEVRCVFDGTICLSVVDNGVGFDTTRASMGMGMNSIRERALAVGATTQITSAPGEGTTLVVMWQPKTAAAAD